MSPSILLKSVFLVIIFHANVSPGYSFERFENILKPPQDRRLHRGLKLNNEMRLMLISDEFTDTSAASLVIGVGAFNDHRNVPGLANLVGHVLLEGGGENPSNFVRFVESYQGSVVAPDTRKADQNFSFRVPHLHFATALREFAQMFTNPRLSNESDPNFLRKPVQAVQQEFWRKAEDENERVAEVEKILCQNLYFINHLYCGNKDTLYQHVRDGDKRKPRNKENASLLEKVKAFYDLWYSSNLMTLAVLGRESLDDLERLVVPLFETVKNKNMYNVTYPDDFHPWGPEQLQQRLCIVPQNADTRSIYLTFPLPDFRDHYKAAPVNYVKHYLLYQGHNTLFTILRDRNLCKSVQFDYWSVAGFAFARLAFRVTELGMTIVDDIITVSFQYIHMLKEKGVEEWMHQQLRKSYRRAFQYRHSVPPEPLEYTLTVARDLQKGRKIEDVLYEEYFRSEWDPSAVHKFLSYLRPSNMNITMVTEACEVFNPYLFEEKYYGTRYMVGHITEDMIARLDEKEPNPLLRLPKPNDLVPETWENFPRDEKEPRDPHVIHQSSISEIWFLHENISSPEICVHLEFFSSLMVNHSLVRRVLFRLFFGLLKNFLDEHVCAPVFQEHGWVTYEVNIIDRGFYVNSCGANDKVPQLLEKIISRMTTNFEDYLSEEKFEAAKERYMSLIKREVNENHFFQAEWCILQYTKYDDDWELDSVQNLERKLRFTDLENFVRRLYRRIFIRGFIYGNYTEERALGLVKNTIENSFRSSHGLLLKEILRPRLIDTDNKHHSFYQMVNKQRDLYGNAYLVQLGTNAPSPLKNVLSYLLHVITLEACQKFFAVQSENQSIPEPACMILQMYPIHALFVKVVSKKLPHNTDTKLEKFLNDIVPSAIRDLPDTDFVSYKYQLESLFRPTYLNLISTKYWKEISHRSYRFDRGQMEVDLLRVLEKSDLLKFAEENLHESSPQRRKLTIHVVPRQRRQAGRKLKSQVPAGATNIEDIYSYKTSSILLHYGFK